ncbi:VOC family protein [Ancylobacter sp. 6x-1]|uniref:VOC family protein n=1 Tax=Ancylobacter crimeensis TaxID=2579147 RepID=A0ABT0D921_9HYPH|nr:VOC family protein [Ancylobacter crimeensis]MCK0196454.1 VOC family protein [Ancylobacter crimeensis]
MLDHVSITVTDPARALPFWDAVMQTLGVPRVWRRDDGAGYGLRNGPDEDERSYLTVLASRGAFAADNRHWCFRAASRDAVDAFHAAALAHGGTCDGPPGLRPHYHIAYYAAFVRDPDGNRIEAVHHRAPAMEQA